MRKAIRKNVISGSDIAVTLATANNWLIWRRFITHVKRLRN